MTVETPVTPDAPREPCTPPLWKTASTFLAIVVVAACVYAADLTRYGATWDEFFHRPTGQMHLRFLRTGDIAPILKDEHASWFPPVAVTIGALFVENQALQRLLPLETDRFHCAAILYASVMAGLVYLIGYRITGCWAAGLLASLLLATHPQYVTHAHNNVRDMGLAAFYTLTVLLLVVAVQARRGGHWWMALAGVCGGLTTDAKQNGMFLLLVGGVWLLLNVGRIGVKRLVGWSAIYVACFIAGFIAFWPYLWVDTVAHLRAVWRFLTDPVIISITATYRDKMYLAGKDLPWHYPWVMFSLLTPPAFIFLTWSGALAALARLFKGDPMKALPLVWLLPLGRFFIPKSAVCYDQIRHILEMLPALALLAAVAVWSLEQALRRFRWSRAAALVLGGTVVLYNVAIVARYRPYGTAYFNWMAGDAAYVTRAFDVEFWGNVYREAAQVLKERHGPEVRFHTAGLGNHILREMGLPNHMTDMLDEEFERVVFMNKQNFIRQNGYAYWLTRNKKPEFTIERDGKILFYEFLPYKDEYLASR